MLDGQQRSLKLGSTGVKYTAFHFNGTDLKILDPIGCAKYDLTYDKCYAAVEEEIKNPPRQEAPTSKPEPAPGAQKADPIAEQLSKAKESERRLKTEDEIYQDLQNRRADFMGLHNNRGVFGDMDFDRKIAHDIASGVDPLEAYQRQRRKRRDLHRIRLRHPWRNY